MFKTKLLPLFVLTLAIAISFAPAAQAGACGGPKGAVSTVRGFDTHVYRVYFRAGRLARVKMVGDGDSNLDLLIYDQNGNLIASDCRLSDFGSVAWRPRWTGLFRIVIRNRGHRSNTYAVRTN